MDFFLWNTKDPLISNKYGIPEPIRSKIVYPDILIVPIVGFDKHKFRLGYGGGFYDRYLNKLNKKKKFLSIGIAFSFQKIKNIPIDKHDQKLDIIITERSVETDREVFAKMLYDEDKIEPYIPLISIIWLAKKLSFKW